MLIKLPASTEAPLNVKCLKVAKTLGLESAVIVLFIDYLGQSDDYRGSRRIRKNSTQDFRVNL